jgi:uncharacterized protein DUF6152
MNSSVRTVLTIAASVFLYSNVAFAHHSFAGEFDANKPIAINGTVTKLEWTNPHGRFFVDVKDAAGNIVNWEFELGSVSALIRLGWTHNALKPGDVVSVSGFLSRNTPHLANADMVTLADGRKFIVGSTGVATDGR